MMCNHSIHMTHKQNKTKTSKEIIMMMALHQTPNTTTFMGGQQGVYIALPTFGHGVTCTKGDKGFKVVKVICVMGGLCIQ